MYAPTGLYRQCVISDQALEGLRSFRMWFLVSDHPRVWPVLVKAATLPKLRQRGECWVAMLSYGFMVCSKLRYVLCVFLLQMNAFEPSMKGKVQNEFRNNWLRAVRMRTAM